MRTESGLFPFRSPNQHDGVCRVERIELGDGRTVVICQELEDNPGQSVTNAFEAVAAQICAKYSLDIRNVIWVDHCEDDEDFHSATIKVSSRGELLKPDWTEMTANDWIELGLEPR